MILFFFLAGASLEADRLWDLSLIAGAFIVLRTISRIVGVDGDASVGESGGRGGSVATVAA